MREHKYLLWIATSYILSSVPLAAQSLMTTSQLTNWAVLNGAFYLAGIWSAARGIAGKYNGSAHPRVAGCIIVSTLLLLYYFSRITDQIWVRMLCLNTGIFLLFTLPIKSLFQSQRSPIFLERILRSSYLLLIAYALARTIAVYVWMPVEIDWEVTRSGYWLLMLAISLVVSLWFTFILLACVMREIFQTLNNERNQDPLTRLLNRRAFFEQADRQLKMPGDQWALITCDVDHFKKINDTWGHAAGDQALELIGETLMQQVRKDDLVARFGGEEFIILLKCKDILAAKNVADRMRGQIAGTHIPAISGNVAASFGVTLITAGQSLLEAIAHADAMLYQAKRSGRNQVAYTQTHHPVTAVE